jgi:hypothetical protein
MGILHFNFVFLLIHRPVAMGFAQGRVHYNTENSHKSIKLKNYVIKYLLQTFLLNPDLECA